MQEGINLKNVWSDDDCVEFDVAASDGCSSFRTRVYVGHVQLAEIVVGLDRFKRQIHGAQPNPLCSITSSWNVEGSRGTKPTRQC